VIERQAGIVIEESEAVAVAGTEIMTVEVAMIATMAEKVDMTGKRTRNQGDLVVVAMIQEVTEGHVPQGIVLETMIDTGTLTSFYSFLFCHLLLLLEKKKSNQKKSTKANQVQCET
jgi:hypothetical protein